MELLIHRLHFAFTVTYHYLFPQLTMGLAPLILVFKTLAIKRNDETYNQAARFWARIFGINFVLGVVTGIPMEFQFGTNWSHFSQFAGGVIGQTLAMEGVFAFFLESAFLGLFLYGEKRLSKWGHWTAALLVFLGSWLSGYFIVATNAWMQHPVGHVQTPTGVQLQSFWALLLNPWALWQYAHTMSGAVITAAFVMCAVGAYYLLSKQHLEHGRLFLKVGVTAGLIFSVLQAFPTGDAQGKMVARHQPITLAAMEALYDTQTHAPIHIMGQPDVEKQKIDNPLKVPGVLSFLTFQRWSAEVKGLNEFDKNDWPTNIPLLYYSYHIMVGLATIFIAVTAVSVLLLRGGALYRAKPLLWLLLMMFPFAYIANTAGWMTAEIGRQPWLVYGLQRTVDGHSKHVSAGNGMFTLLGFMGMYTLLSILFLFLIRREIEHGPEPVETPKKKAAPALAFAGRK
ncbi:MAG: cytochrome ubiquinol oxidase subunit I [Terriglobales bacterium]